MAAKLAYASILARDIAALAEFYSLALGFPEIEGHRSPIYRCLDAGGMELGFNDWQAYRLLAIEHLAPQREKAVSSYLTFEVGSQEELERICALAISNGATLHKPPYDTYYNARQCVLGDPEGNVFRLNYRKGRRLPAAQVENPPWT